MEIRCTAAEKDLIIRACSAADECVLPNMGMSCVYDLHMTCSTCLEHNITWIITDKENKDVETASETT